MAGEAITRDANGALVVPARPIVPVLAGGGAGGEAWKGARRLLDAAVKAAFKGARQVEWLELSAGEDGLLPAATVAAFAKSPVGIASVFPAAADGPAADARLRRALDTSFATARVRSLKGSPGPVSQPLDVAISWDALEHAAQPLDFAPGSVATNGLLRLLRDQAAGIHARLRFGSKERVDSYLRSAGRRETPLVELALSLQGLTRTGAQRLAGAAIRAAVAGQRQTLTIVHDTALAPLTEPALRDWTYQLCEDDFAAETFTSRAYLRMAARLHQTGADEQKAAEQARGAIFVDDLPLDEALLHALERPQGFDAVLATAQTASTLTRLLAAAIGGAGLVPVTTVDPATGRALFGPLATPTATADADANPIALALAGELLLRHLGWNEAAKLVVKSIEGALGRGQLPVEVAPLVAGAKGLGATAFAEAAA